MVESGNHQNAIDNRDQLPEYHCLPLVRYELWLTHNEIQYDGTSTAREIAYTAH